MERDGGGVGGGSECLRWRLSESSLCTDRPPLRKNACSCQCDDFQVACYLLTLKPIQIPYLHDVVIYE